MIREERVAAEEQEGSGRAGRLVERAEIRAQVAEEETEAIMGEIAEDKETAPLVRVPESGRRLRAVGGSWCGGSSRS